ncbi:MAG: PIN domain-containing protein [Ekhidna sp.]|uniref:PIN domain-containing protein n=1 Tax=Ekhidna sp. TaxID=2608089 RepID=UPI0032EBEFF8
MSILVDSSVWIDYFRNGNDQLAQLIEEDLVSTNEIILSELIPALQIQRQEEVIDGLLNLELIELNISWSLIREYQIINLQNGINKVGIPDLIILQQVIEQNLHLFTLDKHFTLMKKHLDFKLFE